MGWLDKTYWVAALLVALSEGVLVCPKCGTKFDRRGSRRWPEANSPSLEQ